MWLVFSVLLAGDADIFPHLKFDIMMNNNIREIIASLF